MALFDSVAREIYERERDRADKAEAQVQYLTKQLVALKRKGFELPHEARPSRIIPAGPTPEESAMKRVHDDLVTSIEEEAAQQISRARGVSIAEARAEVRKVRAEGLGGSIMEPPIL